jgi:hypothetical protein
MSDLSSLAKLLCGGTTIDQGAADCEVSKILVHLRSVLESTISELDWLSTEPAARISMYCPFLARSLLEVGVTAVIGRLDPTRLLVVKRTQEHGEYSVQKPWDAAIRWQGDVLDKKVSELWSPNRAYKDMTKALLGDYYTQLYWGPALKTLADSTAPAGTWLASIKSKSIEEFANDRRTNLGKLYSESSKGIHAEFVVPPGSLYDKATVSNLVNNIVQIMAEIGLLINCLPHIAYKFPMNEAIELFNEIETVEVMK